MYARRVDGGCGMVEGVVAEGEGGRVGRSNHGCDGVCREGGL